MKLRRSHIVAFAVLVAANAALPSIASASFTSGKSNAANTVGAATLSAVTGVTVTPQSANAMKVAWTLPTSQASGVSYKVINNTGGSTPCSGLPATTVTCTDQGVFAGQTYSYSVVAYVPSTNWTKAPSAIAATTPDVFALSPSTTQTAGASFSLTLTAQKATSPTNPALVTDTSYTGGHSLTFSGALASPNGTVPKFNGVDGTSVTTSITFASGLASIPTILYNAAPSTITASEAAVQGQSASFTVSPASGTLSLSNCSSTCPTNAATLTMSKNSSFTATVLRSSTDTHGNSLTLGQISGSATAAGSNGNFTSPSSGQTVTLTFSSGSIGSATTSAFTYKATTGNNGNPSTESITITGPTGWGNYSFNTRQTA